MIVKLIGEYPQFKKYYEEIYTLCQNMEKVMDMFSKELDRNTIQYMLDDMQDEIVAKEAVISEKGKKIAELKAQLARLSSNSD